jgi:hypothetical protein
MRKAGAELLARAEESKSGAESPDPAERVVHGALFGPALVLFEIGLQLRFSFICVSYELRARAEC